MAKNRHLYDTLVGSTIKQNKIFKDVITEGDSIPNGRHTLRFKSNLQVVCILASDVEKFNHPLIMNNMEDITVYVDLRSYVLKSKVKFDLPLNEKIQKSELAGLAINAGALAGLWEAGDSSIIVSTYKPVAKIFASMLSQSMGLNLAASPKDTNLINCLVSMSLYDTVFVKDRNNPVKRAQYVMDLTVNDKRSTTMLLETIGDMYTIESLTKNISDQSASIMLQSISPGSLIEAFANIFHGDNSAEFLGIALEYPPYWWALVHMVSVSRIYKRSLLGGVIHRKVKDYSSLDEHMRDLWSDVSDQYLLNRL